MGPLTFPSFDSRKLLAEYPPHYSIIPTMNYLPQNSNRTYQLLSAFLDMTHEFSMLTTCISFFDVIPLMTEHYSFHYQTSSIVCSFGESCFSSAFNTAFPPAA